MHAEALEYVLGWSQLYRWNSVLDVGGRDVNGSPRGIISADRYLTVDLEPGPGVDVVGDITRTSLGKSFDLVLCLEVLEHAPDWQGVVKACFAHSGPGARLIFTTAGPGRDPHSGHDGGPLREGEHYANIDPWALANCISRRGTLIDLDVLGPDVRAVAEAPMT